MKNTPNESKSEKNVEKTANPGPTGPNTGSLEPPRRGIRIGNVWLVPTSIPRWNIVLGCSINSLPRWGLVGGGALFALFAATLALLLALSLLAGLVSYLYLAVTLPPPSELTSIRIAQSTKIFDRNGDLLQEIYDPNGGRRTSLPTDQISPWIKKATIAVEDPNFYSDPGIDPIGVARAIYYILRDKKIVTGGSTITQQLVKNTLLTPEVTVERKLREAILALEVARRYSKDEVLGMYLNTVYYGNLSYGVQAASQSYFHKDAKDLDLGEASLLAGLVQAPASYDPCDDPDAALTRQDYVLGLMVKRGYISETQSQAAADEMSQRLQSPEFDQQCTPKAELKAPHFVQYVRQVIEEQYGPGAVYKNGFQIFTTYDSAVENIVEEEARKQIGQLKGQNVTNAAAVVANPQTGAIYAMMGSVNFAEKTNGQVNVATSLRQPGSSIKPLNYIAAFEKGWTLATPILDVKTVFPNGTQPYVPVNYDHKYHGIVNPRAAIANSLNIPAVRTLYFVGVPQMIDTARRFGITTFQDPSRYGLALTLGGGEVKLVELTGAYAVFANNGQRVPLTPFRKIVDGVGKVVLDNEKNVPAGEKVIDPRLAYLMTSVLSDNNARMMEFGPNSPLKLSRPAAAKTGTTSDFRDNWTMGYTPELVVGVWVGNSNNTPMVNSTGITGAAPIWHDVIERIYREVDPFSRTAPHDFVQPAGIVQLAVCNESGLLPTNACPTSHRHNEIFLDNQAPTEPDKFWNGVWGLTCIPAYGGAETTAAGVTAYPDLVKQVEARGMPQGLAGLIACRAGAPEAGPAAPPPGEKKQKEPPPPPKDKKNNDEH